MPSPYLSNYGVVTVTDATLSLTAGGHAGQTVVSDLAATQTFTLPAATGSGNKYEVFVKTTKTGDLVIQVASASDVMSGTAILFADAGDTVVGFATAATSDTITLDGTTTGGIAGAIVKLQDIASGVWRVEVVSDASGTEATPFSAAVS
jgi:hypothetical protein